MKKLVTVSLFVFWVAVTAILTAGLVFYQNYQTIPIASNNQPVISGGGQITLDTKEISKHNAVSDCWLIITSKIYNVSSYLSAHPGGVGAIVQYCGQEATRAFDTKNTGQPHSGYAAGLLANYYIGDLNQTIGQNQLIQNTQNTNSIIPPGRGEGDDD